jgi:hypothetical protein
MLDTNKEITFEKQIINLFGEVEELRESICNYKTCYHKFSLHNINIHICECQHPWNSTIGVSKSEWIMSIEENLSSIAATVGFRGITRFLIGYFVKKIVKISCL